MILTITKVPPKPTVVAPPKMKLLTIFILSFICSILTQISLYPPDYTGKINSSSTTPANFTPIQGHEPVENGYFFELGGGIITLDLPDSPISGLMFEFAEPVYYWYGVDLLFSKSIEGSSKLYTSRHYLHYSNFLYIDLDTDIYDSMQINIFNPRDWEDINLRSVVNPYLNVVWQADELTLHDIYFFNDTWTRYEQELSSITPLMSLCYFVLFFAFFVLVVKDFERIKIYLPFYLLFFLLLTFFSNQVLTQDDLILFYPIREQQNLIEYSISRFQTWNSRFIIEVFPYYLVHYWTLWALLSSLLSVLVCYSLSEFLKPVTFWKNMLISTLFLSFPLLNYGQIGWVASTCNYLWALSFGLYTFLLVAKDLRNEKVSKLFYGSTLLSCLYAANHEQTAALLLGFYIVFYSYYAIIKKSIKYLTPHLLITLGSLAIHLFAPANQIRMSSVTDIFYPEFSNFTVFSKLELGYNVSLHHFINYYMEVVGLVICFVIALFFIRLVQNKSSFSLHPLPYYTRPILYTLFPLFLFTYGSTTFNLFINLMAKMPAFSSLDATISRTGSSLDPSNVGSFFPIITATFFFLSLLIAVVSSFRNKLTGLFAGILLIAGLASRIILGFSSVIWITHEATYLYFCFSFLGASLLLYQEIVKESSKKQLHCLHFCIFLLFLSKVYESFQGIPIH